MNKQCSAKTRRFAKCAFGLAVAASSSIGSAQLKGDHAIQDAANYSSDSMATLVIDTRSGTPTYWYALRRQHLYVIDELLGVPQDPIIRLGAKPTITISPTRTIRILVIESKGLANSGAPLDTSKSKDAKQIESNKDWSVFVQPAAIANSNSGPSATSSVSSIFDSQFFQPMVDVTANIPNSTDAPGQGIRVLETWRTFNINLDGNFQVAVVAPLASTANIPIATPPVTPPVAVTPNGASSSANADLNLVYSDQSRITVAQSSLVSVNEATQYSMVNAFSPGMAFARHFHPSLALGTVEYSFTPSLHVDAIALLNGSSSTSASTSGTGSSTGTSSETNVTIGEGLSYSTWLGNPYDESGKKFFGFPLRLTVTAGFSMLSFSKGALGPGSPFFGFSFQIPLGNSGSSTGSAKNKGATASN